MRIFKLFPAVAFWALSSAWAAEPSTKAAGPSTRVPQSGPLEPGRTAGVKGAARQARIGLALIGAGAIIAVVVVAAGTGGSGGGSAQQNMQIAPATTSP